MANTPISMSGVISLDTKQTELLTTLGLEVPSMMTREHFVRLLSRADQIADSFSGGLVARVTREELTRLKACFGVA